jgi:hypothetical protein
MNNLKTESREAEEKKDKNLLNVLVNAIRGNQHYSYSVICIILMLYFLIYVINKMTPQMQENPIFISVTILIISIVFSAFSWFIFSRSHNSSLSDSIEKYEGKLSELERSIRALAKNIDNASILMKFAKLSKTEFSADEFKIFWSEIINASERKLLIVNYIEPDDWIDNPIFIDSLRYLKSKIDFMKSNLHAERIFILKTESELSKLSGIFKMHRECKVRARVAYLDKIKGFGLGDSIDHTFMICDGKIIGLFYFKDRKILKMKTAFETSFVEKYEEIYRLIENESFPAPEN